MRKLLPLLTFIQFVDKLLDRDRLKAEFPNQPRKWTSDPYLRSQKVLGLRRREHAGTIALHRGVARLDADSALALGIIYRCSGSNLQLVDELAKAPRHLWPKKLNSYAGVMIKCNAYRPTAWPAGVGSGRRFLQMDTYSE